MPRTRRATAFFFSIALLMVSGCDSASDEAAVDNRAVVVASIFPIGDLAQQLGGDLIRVEVLLPPGASPATFDVTPRQLRTLQDANLFLMIGGGLDEWLNQIPEASGKNPRVIRLSEGIPLLAQEEEEEGEEAHGHEPAHGSGNPHIWLDPILVRDRVLPKIAEALITSLPQEAETLREREGLLSDSLTALHEEILRILEPYRGRAFIATHAAWTYLATRYGLDEAGVIHAHPGQEPSSRELANLLGVAENRGVSCLFTEPQLGEVAARAIATELSLPTCVLDPLGGPEVTDRTDYFQLLRFNTRMLAQGLEGPGL